MSFIDYNFRTTSTPSQVTDLKRETIGPARVIDVIVDSDHPLYDKYDGPSGVGMIFYRLLTQTDIDRTDTGEEEYTGQAYPISSYQKLLPLKNEIVFLVDGPDPQVALGSGQGRMYYITPFSIWNHPHHNAIPVKPEDSQDSVNIGKGIEASDKVAPLQPFPGDVLLEGRLGQSIRFTGHAEGKSPFTDSSNTLKPLTIISNGQKEPENGFLHIVEDINEDPSSIFMTSDHTIPLTLIKDKRDSYDNKPDTPSNYKGAQLLFNSDRLTFNARKSDILFSSAESIGMNSTTVNIDGEDYICADADKIYLGVKARTNSGANKQPAVLGHRMEAFLQDILDQLIAVSKAMGRAKTVDGKPVPTINLRGNSSQIVFKQLKRQLNPKGNSNLKSKKLYIE